MDGGIFLSIQLTDRLLVEVALQLIGLSQISILRIAASLVGKWGEDGEILMRLPVKSSVLVSVSIEASRNLKRIFINN